jgi:curved DNA-binding protein CbpA
MDSNISHYYKVLELEQGASQSEIKQAYRDLAMVWHPDRFSNPRMQQKAEARLKQINAAYEFLKSYQPKPEQQTTNPEKSRESYSPPPSAPQQRDQPHWEIYLAKYGTGNNFKDVTSLLKSHIKNSGIRGKAIHLKIDNSLFEAKENINSRNVLIIYFYWRGEKNTRKFREGGTIYITEFDPIYWSYYSRDKSILFIKLVSLLFGAVFVISLICSVSFMGSVSFSALAVLVSSMPLMFFSSLLTE